MLCAHAVCVCFPMCLYVHPMCLRLSLSVCLLLCVCVYVFLDFKLTFGNESNEISILNYKGSKGSKDNKTVLIYTKMQNLGL